MSLRVNTSFAIGSRKVGPGLPVCIVAEISSSHSGSLELAQELVRAAGRAGADAVKFQFYTPDEMTVDSDDPAYTMTSGPWAGQRLYDLYRETATPREWLPWLVAEARDAGLEWFSSVFGLDSLAFLEGHECPAYKVASPEATDAKLVAALKATGKPILMSDGMDPRVDIEPDLLMACVSEYPARPEQYYLPCEGLSDHTDSNELAVAAVASGAMLVEKHILLYESDYHQASRPLPEDHGFAQNPTGFRDFVHAIRLTEALFAQKRKPAGASSQWRRRLVYAHELPAGYTVTAGDIRTARCSRGLEPDQLAQVLGRTLEAVVRKGEPVT